MKRKTETQPAITGIAPSTAAAPPVDETLYTRKEVAVLAKVSVHTVARDVRYGLLKEIKFNRRRLRYGADAVRAYLAGFRRP